MYAMHFLNNFLFTFAKALCHIPEHDLKLKNSQLNIIAKTCPPGFRLGSGRARIKASLVTPNLGEGFVKAGSGALSNQQAICGWLAWGRLSKAGGGGVVLF